MQDQNLIHGEETVEVEAFGTISGRPADSGWKLTVTKPMQCLGFNAPEIADDDSRDVAVRFDDSDTDNGVLAGVILIEDELEDGRTYQNQRKIRSTGSVMTLTLPDEVFHQIGVECNREGGNPPVVEVLAGNGALIIKRVELHALSMESIDQALHTLPDQIREDWLAVEIDGKEPATVAESRDINTEVYHNPGQRVMQNVEKANEMLGEQRNQVIESIESEDEDRMMDFTPGERVRIFENNDGAYSISITDTIRQALSDDATGMDAKHITLHFSIEGAGEGVVPAQLATGDEAINGHGRATSRKVNAKGWGVSEEDGTPEDYNYNLRLPESVIDELGYDVSAPSGEYISTLTGSNVVAFQPNQKVRATVSKPDLMEVMD